MTDASRMMSLVDKLRKKQLIWERAVVHYSIFFVLGIFLGLAPTSHHPSIISSTRDLSFVKQSFGVPQSVMVTPEVKVDRSSNAQQTGDVEEENKRPDLISRKLLIVVTITRTTCNGNSDVGTLARLGNTLRLVPPPLLWILVEGRCQEQEYDDTVYTTLMKTGVMYKNLVVAENYTTGSEAEIADWHEEVALRHIINHRLSGIVHFSSPWDVYDLGFFEELRGMFGEWPVSTDHQEMDSKVLGRRSCGSSSKTMGWIVRFRQPSSMLDLRNTSADPCVGFNSTVLFDRQGFSGSSVTTQV
ncbi:hypothetical protein MLD38_026599 [Melastoma candidum]|uniref:Uncharacterized protein n=1 Tax=Melastoma candidum TaxID=119954 RepID=A0ACB9P5K4_9MYRT|nr:hypothetical protein MLD38_026599 [Melastoma candidum]